MKFYFSQLDTAFRNADTEAVEAMAAVKCKICTAMLEGVKDVRAKKQRYASDLITVQNSSIMDFVTSTAGFSQ